MSFRKNTVPHLSCKSSMFCEVCGFRSVASTPWLLLRACIRATWDTFLPLPLTVLSMYTEEGNIFGAMSNLRYTCPEGKKAGRETTEKSNVLVVSK